MVDAAQRGAARDVALGPVREGRHELGRRLVPLDLPEDLVQVPAGAPVPVRRPLTRRAVVPALAAPAASIRSTAVCELLRALGPPGDVPEARRIALGDLQGVVEEVTPAAEVRRAADRPRVLQTEHVGGEAQRLVGVGLTIST